MSELYTFYFKIIYTERTFNLTFSPDATIKFFIESVNSTMHLLLEDDMDNQIIEIVETGQYNNVNGRDPELAPKINYNDEYTLRDVYGHRVRNTAFYIRFVQQH